MLMHEWIKYRNAQVKRAVDGQPDAADDVAPEAVAVAEVPDDADDAPVQDTGEDAESTDREKAELIASLQVEIQKTGADVRERMERLHARQRQLPMEMDAGAPDVNGSRGATETREDLVTRLLDPTLTLREASLLLDVCPTTVRRYTNRGLLNCYRTPGNQRRFRLSDMLEFMERRDRENL